MRLYFLMLIKRICSIIAPKWYIRRRFISNHHYTPNFKEPKRHSEKIAARKFNYTKEMSVLSDKIAVRDYVREKVGEEYLIPSYAVLDKLTEKAFEELPESFVIKANHGSRFNLIVRDKSQFTFEEVKKLTDRWLRNKYYLIGMELHYRHIKPKLIVEKLLLDSEGKVPKDYKLHHFKNNGDPKLFIGVHTDRFENYEYNCYDEDWNVQQNPWVGEKDIYENSVIKQRPKELDLLKELCGKLASRFKYVRVDFYIVDDRIYFGEMTFTPNGGAMKLKREEVDRCLGGLWGD
ncbi:glycosyltransferase [Leptobacterium flavescens]|uniref:Glycosyltransferase n=1 Tax=Leptobacterium flavescens TaxID=472055 RepID=A0A6P0UNF0_9FLAO|nr:ATP-grasp fold amidoligase family protein [Leptobacterium flavescens]NER13990.1 glycosyltransferase [Leptobacterium flavescens]